MDAVSLLAPGAAPTAAPVGATAVEAGAAFADVFASALGDAVPAPQALPTALLTPGGFGAPSAMAEPTLPNSVKPVDLATPPSAPNGGAVAPLPDVAPKPVAPEDETSSPAAVERPARRSVGKGPRPVAKPEAPPEPPPPDPVAASPTQEAAPEAPNAPAQEPDPKVEDETPPADAPASAPWTALAMVAAAPVVATIVPTSSTSSVEGALVVPVTTAPSQLSSSTAGANPVASTPAEASDIPVELSPEVMSVVANLDSAPLRRESQAVERANSPDIKAPTGGTHSQTVSTLPAAPDLDVVPQVSAAPVVVVAEPKVANVAVAAQVVASKPVEAPSLEPEGKIGKVEVKTGSAPALELAVAEKRDTDDRPQEDAPKGDASPIAPVAAKETVATARPEAGTDRPSVDRHLVVRQVADRIESLAAARPREGVTVHLEPRDLGTVTLVVKGLASALDVQVFASDDRVRESLGASRPELAQALAPRGIELREIRVSPAPASSTTSAGGGSANANSDGRPRGGAQSQQSQSSPNGFRSATSTAPRTRAARSTGRGVDVLV